MVAQSNRPDAIRHRAIIILSMIIAMSFCLITLSYGQDLPWETPIDEAVTSIGDVVLPLLIALAGIAFGISWGFGFGGVATWAFGILAGGSFAIWAASGGLEEFLTG